MLTVLAIIAAAATLAAIAGLAWLWLSSSWQVVDDESAPRPLRTWWKPKSRLLTYRRDGRGRFRRHRR
jgi:hypothetical protein